MNIVVKNFAGFLEFILEKIPFKFIDKNIHRFREPLL